jgi:hypothetical protein
MNQECLICFEEKPTKIVYPCKHSGACFECSLKITSCPVCNDLLCVKLRFKLPSGKFYHLQVNVNDTPESIKKLINDLMGDKVSFQLVCGGRIIKYDKCFGEFKNDEVIHIVPNYRGD